MQKRNKGLSQAELDGAAAASANDFGAQSTTNDDGRLFEEFFDPVLAREGDLGDDANDKADAISAGASKKRAKSSSAQQAQQSSASAATSSGVRMYAMRNERATSLAATTALALGANSAQVRAHSAADAMRFIASFVDVARRGVCRRERRCRRRATR